MDMTCFNVEEAEADADDSDEGDDDEDGLEEIGGNGVKDVVDSIHKEEEGILIHCVAM